MPFRNRIVRLSQLIADKIVGALIETAETGTRWVLQGGPGLTGVIQGFSGDVNEVVEASISIVADTLTMFGNLFSTNTTGARPFISFFGGAGASKITLKAEELDMIGGATFDQLFSMDDSGFAFGAAGTRFQEIVFVVFTGVTDGTGVLAVPHGMGGSPFWAGAFGGNTGAGFNKLVTTSLGGGVSVGIKAFNTTTGAVAPGIGIGGYLVAVR